MPRPPPRPPKSPPFFKSDNKSGAATTNPVLLKAISPPPPASRKLLNDIAVEDQSRIKKVDKSITFAPDAPTAGPDPAGPPATNGRGHQQQSILVLGPDVEPIVKTTTMDAAKSAMVETPPPVGAPSPLDSPPRSTVQFQDQPPNLAATFDVVHEDISPLLEGEDLQTGGPKNNVVPRESSTAAEAVSTKKTLSVPGCSDPAVGRRSVTLLHLKSSLTRRLSTRRKSSDGSVAEGVRGESNRAGFFTPAERRARSMAHLRRLVRGEPVMGGTPRRRAQSGGGEGASSLVRMSWVQPLGEDSGARPCGGAKSLDAMLRLSSRLCPVSRRGGSGASSSSARGRLRPRSTSSSEERLFLVGPSSTTEQTSLNDLAAQLPARTKRRMEILENTSRSRELLLPVAERTDLLIAMQDAGSTMAPGALFRNDLPFWEHLAKINRIGRAFRMRHFFFQLSVKERLRTRKFIRSKRRFLKGRLHKLKKWEEQRQAEEAAQAARKLSLKKLPFGSGTSAKQRMKALTSLRRANGFSLTLERNRSFVAAPPPPAVGGPSATARGTTTLDGVHKITVHKTASEKIPRALPPGASSGTTTPAAGSSSSRWGALRQQFGLQREPTRPLDQSSQMDQQQQDENVLERAHQPQPTTTTSSAFTGGRRKSLDSSRFDREAKSLLQEVFIRYSFKDWRDRRVILALLQDIGLLPLRMGGFAMTENHGRAKNELKATIMSRRVLFLVVFGTSVHDDDRSSQDFFTNECCMTTFSRRPKTAITRSDVQLQSSIMISEEDSFVKIC